MKCEICHNADAQTVLRRKKKDGTEEELYVCKSCAAASKKKRKSAEEKEELEWYGIDKNYDPNDPDIISCQEAAEDWDEALREK